MRIRNRLPDIRQLLNQVLQSYFKLEIDRLFSDKDWKQDLWSCIESGLNSQYRTSYAGADSKIRQIGLENYTIGDMDATILFAVLSDWDWNYSSNRRSKQVNAALETLKSDRNIDSHLTGNETESEMREFAFGCLHDLRLFIQAVSNDKHYEQLDVHKFAKHYKGLIDSIQQAIDADYAEVVRDDECLSGMKRDIVTIKNSWDSLATWGQIVRDRYLTPTYLEDGTYQRFLEAASAAGILWADSNLASLYFEGMPDHGVAPDYEKAAKCYQRIQAQGKLNVQQLLNLAAIYQNGLAAGHGVEEGNELLMQCRSDYSTYKVGSYTFYRFKSKIKNNR